MTARDLGKYDQCSYGSGFSYNVLSLLNPLCHDFLLIWRLKRLNLIIIICSTTEQSTFMLNIVRDSGLFRVQFFRYFFCDFLPLCFVKALFLTVSTFLFETS